MKQKTLPNKKTPKLRDLLKSNGIEIGALSLKCGMSASSFRSKLSDGELYRYFSDEEYLSVIAALESHIKEVKAFINKSDRQQLTKVKTGTKSKKIIRNNYLPPVLDTRQIHFNKEI